LADSKHSSSTSTRKPNQLLQAQVRPVEQEPLANENVRSRACIISKGFSEERRRRRRLSEEKLQQTRLLYRQVKTQAFHKLCKKLCHTRTNKEGIHTRCRTKSWAALDQHSADLGKFHISLLHFGERPGGFGLSTYCLQVYGQLRERASRKVCTQANVFDPKRAVRWLGEETYADSSLYRCTNTPRIWVPSPKTSKADGKDCYESDHLVQSRLLRRQDYWKRQEERESAERQRAVRAWSMLMPPSSISHRRRTKKKVDASWTDSMPGTASQVHFCRRSLPPGRKIRDSLSMKREVEVMILLSGWRVSGTVLKRRSAEIDILE
jgi:hypothetical protein